MSRLQPLFVFGVIALSLAGCGKGAGGSAPEGHAATSAPTAADGGTPQAAPQITAADVKIVPNTPDDPASAACGAPRVREYLGRADGPDIRQELAAAAQAPGGVRFVLPGQPTTEDLRPDRLNVMIDTTGVIRDLRCG